MDNKLTDEGYQNLIKVAEEEFGVRLTREFIDENYEELYQAFPNPDNDNGEEIEESWTLYGEANNGGIFDTCARGFLADYLARKLTNGRFQTWPTYGDGPVLFDVFLLAYQEGMDRLGLRP